MDGFHPVNVGKLVIGDPDRASARARPAGVQQMLIRSGIETKGAHAVVRGPLAPSSGKPMANLLIQDGPGGNATVTVCHSRTRDLPAVTPQRRHPDRRDRQGRSSSPADMVRPGAVVIDVGINRVDDATQPKGYRLTGDVDYRAGRRGGLARSRRCPAASAR